MDAEYVIDRDAKADELESTFSYNGYQVVRKELFAHLRDLAIVIRTDSITFNTACITELKDDYSKTKQMIFLTPLFRAVDLMIGGFIFISNNGKEYMCRHGKHLG